MKNLRPLILLLITLLFSSTIWAVDTTLVSIKKPSLIDQSRPAGISDKSWSSLAAVVQEANLTADNGDSGDRFGHSVSISGNRALIGANKDDVDGSIYPGSAYIFELENGFWVQKANLIASDRVAGDAFGSSVSLVGDRALVGSPGDDSDDGLEGDLGSVYVFDYDGNDWIETTRLMASDGADGDRFGWSVSLDGDRALIGAYREDNINGEDAGAAYVFDLSAGVWSQTDKLTTDDGNSGSNTDRFGVSVSLYGDRALIGAYWDSDSQVESFIGSAYVFELSGGNWSQTTKLVASDRLSGDKFGTSVSLNQDTALIGSTGTDDSNGDSVGAAYVFDYSGGNWSETIKLLASDGAANDQFGKSVSLSDNKALIGAYADDDNGDQSGSAYLFELSGVTWSQTDKLTADDGAIDDGFGSSVSLSGVKSLIGAPSKGSSTGAAYIFAAPSYSVGGTVSGLAAGNSVVLQNNLTDSLEIVANQSFDFPVELGDTESYAVTVLTNPSSPNNFCSITGGNSGQDDGTGTIATADYTGIVVNCSYVCETDKDGDWNNPLTWENSCNGTFPQNNDAVIIKTGHTVTLTQNTSTISGLDVEVGGFLNVEASGFGHTLFANASGADIDLQNASITLLGDLTIDANAHNILLGPINGEFGLTLNSSAETQLLGTLGGTNALTSLITNATGTTILADTNGAVGVGTIFVNGDRVFNDPVTLAQHATIQGDGGVITFGNTVDSATSTDKDLTFSNVANSTITFNGKVGNINRLKKLQFLSSSTSTTVFNTSHILTKRNQRYGTDILINSPTNNLLMNISIGGTIKVGTSSGNQTLRGEVAGVESLTIETPGVVSITSTIGDNNQSLDDFTIKSTSTMLLYNDITVDGKQAYIGPMALAGDAVLTATILDFRDTVDNAGFDLTLNPSTIVFNNDAFTGSGDLIKQGAGFFDMNLVSTLTGDIYINQGSINNSTNTENIFPNVSAIYLGSGTSSSLGRSTTDVFSLGNGQTLAGTGTCDCILDAQSGSIVSPGFSSGQLTSNELNMQAGSTLNIELNGILAGSGYDQYIANTVNLDTNLNGGATLNVTLGNFYQPTIGDEFNIIDANSAIVTTFNGLAQGASFWIGDSLFAIDYTGGDGNDVVLTLIGTTIIYVDSSTVQVGNGSSWGTAFDNLQDALAVATSGMEIWIAQGVYYPDIGAGQINDDVTSTFNLINGVKLYGGFNGTETDLSMRDPVTNVTVLSGDIDADVNGGADTVDSNGVTEHFDDLVGNNAYHVVTTLLTDDSTVIDGLTITAGRASGTNPDNRGSAIYCNNSNVTINAVIVQGNRSDSRAALWDCDSLISQSSFINNYAGDVGAVTTTSTTFTDTLFMGNRAAGQGSVFYLGGGTLNLTRVQFIANFSRSVVRAQSTTLNFNDVLFSGNLTRGALDLSSSTGGTLNNITMIGNRTDLSSGAGITSTASGDLIINNSIFWNNQDSTGLGALEASIDHTGIGIITLNSSILEGSGGSGSWNPTSLVDGGGNVDQDPMVVLTTDPTPAPTAVGDAHLTALSMAAVDTGDNSKVTSTTDLDGRMRIINGTVDMGAYEYTDLIFANGFE